MNCVKCGNQIPEGRLKALPGTKTCVNCSGAARVAGVPIISGKNEYSALMITDQETAAAALSAMERRGLVSNGMKTSIN